MPPPRGDGRDRLRVAAFGLRALDGIDGGIETHARELYPRLAARNCDIEVITRTRYEKASGREQSSAGRVASRPLPAPSGNGLEAFVHAVLATGYCGFKRPDVVHVHGIGPAVLTPLLRLLGLRVVMTHHGHDYDADKWGPLARTMLRVGEWIGVRTANAVITVSDSLRKDILERYGVECRTIYNGFVEKPNLVEPPDDTRLISLERGKFVLVVGRITAHKRIDDVIAAFESVSTDGLRLIVCGGRQTHDPYLDRIEQAAACNPRIVLAGYVPTERLPWLYSRALCTVMASSYEGMPLAVLEALSSGSRVVLSDIDAHRELELDPSCYFPLGDIEALAGRIAALHAIPATERSNGARMPLNSTGRFAWTTIADQTRAVFE
jgi:glycosyltransferase involved in cell wall biosynthesis